MLIVAVACAAFAAPPASALADGQLDPSFNGTGFHVGSAGEKTVFSNLENRIPMVVQSDGKIVVGGSRNGAMTLVRYNTNGTIDTSFGSGGFATTQFTGTPGGSPGSSGAVALALDGDSIVAAGFGGSQSMVVARFSPSGALGGSVVCFAPHLIDYTARAVAVLPDGNVVVAGYARDRLVTPAVLYGQRTVVNVPAGGAGSCGDYQSNGTLSLGSSDVVIDGLSHDGTVTDASLGGRFYDAAAALPDNRYVLAATGDTPGSAWVSRFTSAGVGTLDPSFGGGTVTLPSTSLHALAVQADGSVLAAGESVDAAVAANRQMLVARIDANGVLGGFGNGGIALSRVAGGNDSGQAIAVQSNGSVLVGGSANFAGKSAFGITRFTAGGVRDPSFGSGGQVVTPFGAPAINGYITGMGLSGNLLAVSGRLTDPSGTGLDVVAARYFATGAPPPPPPPPAASTLRVENITGTSAHITGTVNANGTASNWYLEYGTSKAYGTKTGNHALAASTNDVDVGITISGLRTGTTYHARFVITNSVGTVGGDDVTFKTLGTAGKGAKRICKVPKVTGKNVNTARRKVVSAGCKVKIVYKVATKRPKGYVLAQSRKPGKKLVYHALVKLTVAVKHR